MEQIDRNCKYFTSTNYTDGPSPYHINDCSAGNMKNHNCSECNIYILKLIDEGKATTVDRMREYFKSS